MSSTATADPSKVTTTVKQQSSLPLEDSHAASPGNVKPASGNGKALEMKGSLVPMTHLEINDLDVGRIKDELAAKTAQAPDFFKNLPVVLSFDKIAKEETIDFPLLIETCESFSIKPVAIRGGTTSVQEAAQAAGLALMPKLKDKGESTIEPAKASLNTSLNEPPAQQESSPAASEAEAEEDSKIAVQKERQISKVVKHPIRSGQQVYAADGDLVVLASVSAGAEILADGNIHVYGALRGRALAGVKGNSNARIFCQSMAAELVSVAGQYKISEDIAKENLGKPTQVYLQDDLLVLKALEL